MSRHLPVPADGTAAEYAALIANPFLPDGDKDVQRRVSKMTQAKKKAFCEAIANGASPTRAAKALDVARSTVYYQRSIDLEFDAAWEEALEQDADRYEDALEQLATKTKNVGAVIFALKNKRPGKWQDRHDLSVEKRSVNVEVGVQLTERQQRLMLEWLAEEPSVLAPPPSRDATEKRGHAS